MMNCNGCTLADLVPDTLRRGILRDNTDTRLFCLYLMNRMIIRKDWDRGYKFFSCSFRLSMKIFPLINVKMLTIVGILTFMSKKNSILSHLSLKEKLNFLLLLYL